MYTWSNTPLVLLFESTQIDHSMDKGAVFIVKCLQAFCIVVAAEIGIFQIVQVTADPLDQLVREDRIKVGNRRLYDSASDSSGTAFYDC